MKLQLSGDGFDRGAEFRAQVEGTQCDALVEILEFGESLVGASDGFALAASIKSPSIRAGRGCERVEMPRSCRWQNLRLPCEGVKMKQLLDLKGFSRGSAGCPWRSPNVKRFEVVIVADVLRNTMRLPRMTTTHVRLLGRA